MRIEVNDLPRAVPTRHGQESIDKGTELGQETAKIELSSVTCGVLKYKVAGEGRRGVRGI